MPSYVEHVYSNVASARRSPPAEPRVPWDKKSKTDEGDSVCHNVLNHITHTWLLTHSSLLLGLKVAVTCP